MLGTVGEGNPYESMFVNVVDEGNPYEPIYEIDDGTLPRYRR